MLSAVWLLVIVLALGVLLARSADRDTEGEITEGGSVSAMSLQVGDCLNGLEEGADVQNLPAVPCTQPHEGEVYAVFDLPEGDYPGEAAIIDQADAGCGERLSSVAPEAYDDPSVGLFYLYPVELSWPDDREIVCIAISTSGRTARIDHRLLKHPPHRDCRRQAFEPGEHGEHATVVVVRGWQVELGEDRRDVLLDGAVGDDERAGDRRVGPALGHQAQHLPLPGREPVEWVAAAPGEQLGNDLGIEHCAARHHALQRIGRSASAETRSLSR